LKRIRTIIVENEPSLLESFLDILTGFPSIDLVGSCASVSTAYEQISTLNPDLVFLDIELDGGTAFDVLSRIAYIDFEIVFTTAHHQYAIDAIKMSALDYILKPFDAADIQFAITKLSDKKDRHGSIQHLISNLLIPKENERSIALHTNDGITYMHLSDIIYCRADNNYTVFVSSVESEQMVSFPLKKYDNLLSDKQFFRIHQTYLVNLKFIKKYSKNNGGEVILKNGLALPVSRRKKDELLLELSRMSI
jgi:two-component system LytT family response regulator